MFDFLKDKALVVWDDTQPCVVKYNGETVKSLSAYRQVAEGTNSIQYSSEYKQNLLKLQMNGNSEQYQGLAKPVQKIDLSRFTYSGEALDGVVYMLASDNSVKIPTNVECRIILTKTGNDTLPSGFVIVVGNSIDGLIQGSSATPIFYQPPDVEGEIYNSKVSAPFYIGVGNIDTGIIGEQSSYEIYLKNNFTLEIQPVADVQVPSPYFPQPIKNVIYDSRLPIEYQEVEYIQNTGTQYLNTGVFASENNSFEVKAQLVHTDTTSQTVWGGRQSGTLGSNQLHFVKTGELLQFACGNNVVANKTYDTDLHTYKANKNLLYVDGTLLYTATSATITTQNEIYLFATNTAGTLASYGGSVKIYYFKIWSNDALVRDYVPCYRKTDGATGLYDLVTKQFYGNTGTGEFTIGKNIETDTMTLELMGVNLFNRPDVTMAANNEYYKNLSSGGFILQPSTTYTVSFDYEFISVDEADKPYWSIGRGAGGYATDIIYNIPFPNFTKGRAYDTFTTPSNLGTSNKLFFRVPRCDKRTTCEVSLSNFMLNYGEEALPFEPYFEPVTVDIPPSVTVGGSTIPLRFARVEDKADYIEVNRLDGTANYVRNIAYLKMPHQNKTYTYIDMKGTQSKTGEIEQVMTRAKGICTHTSKVGNYTSTQAKNAMWVGVNQTVLYWIGILDTLGFTTIEEFNTWLDEQEAQGTPVELIYKLKTPITTDITSTDLGQALLNFVNSTENATIIISAKSSVDSTLVAEYIKWGGNL